MRKGETIPEELRNQFTKKTASDMMPRERAYAWATAIGSLQGTTMKKGE